MPFAKSSARPRGNSFRQRQRRHVAFFEAMESCAGSSRLPVKDIWKYRPTVTTVTFGHLYGDLAVLDKQTIESEVWAAVYDEVKTKLIAMDPQRLGSPTASFDLHFAKEHLQFSQAYRQRGQMRISLAGKDCYLTVGCKGGGVAPELAQVVVKQLDPRWVVQGVTSALLHTAGYTDVTVEEEHAGGLPSHLSVHSSYLGRSVAVAMVRAPAADPSLRKLPRSLWFQGVKVSIAVTRSLDSKFRQRQAQAAAAATSAKQTRKKARRKQLKAKQQASVTPSQPAAGDSVAFSAEPSALQPSPEPCTNDVVLRVPLSLPLPCHAVEATTTALVLASPPQSVADQAAPPSGKRKDADVGSNSSDAAEPCTSDSLAIVPVTPEDDTGIGVRRSTRPHKKPRPYYEGASLQHDTHTSAKGLKFGFFG